MASQSKVKVIIKSRRYLLASVLSNTGFLYSKENKYGKYYNCSKNNRHRNIHDEVSIWIAFITIVILY